MTGKARYLKALETQVSKSERLFHEVEKGWRDVELTTDEILLACAEFAGKKFGATHVDDGRIRVDTRPARVRYCCSVKISLDPTIKDRA